jgi:hypothetical protein
MKPSVIFEDAPKSPTITPLLLICIAAVKVALGTLMAVKLPRK